MLGNLKTCDYKCGHRVTKDYGIVRCVEATSSGVQCTSDKLKTSAMASTKVQEDCPNCRDEG